MQGLGFDEEQRYRVHGCTLLTPPAACSVERHRHGTPLPEGSVRHDALPLGLQILGPRREAMQARGRAAVPTHTSPCPAAAKEAYPATLTSPTLVRSTSHRAHTRGEKVVSHHRAPPSRPESCHEARTASTVRHQPASQPASPSTHAQAICEVLPVAWLLMAPHITSSCAPWVSFGFRPSLKASPKSRE